MELLERLGLRKLHLLISDRTGQKPLPPLAQAHATPGYRAEEIEDQRHDARYFGRANLLRIVTHLPILAMFIRFGNWWLGGLFIALAVFHAVLVILERYKSEIVARLVADPDAVPLVVEKAKSETWGDWWFVPKRWETEKFYVMVGLVQFRRLVEFIIWTLGYTREERRAGKTLEFVRGASKDVVEFENQSRVNECVHLVMAGIDLIPVVYALATQLWFALPYTLWILWGDLYCVLLQRLNRCRIWTLIRRARKIEARSA